MRFNEKLHLLMKMANTSNTQLATTLNVDPSLISRWRTGEREPSGDSRYIPLIGNFFASQAQRDYQRVALLELTGYQLEDKSVEEATIASYIIRWLSNEPKISIDSVGSLLDSIGNIGSTVTKLNDIPLPSEPSGKQIQAQFFSGKNGLRSATIKLLLQTINSEGAQKRLLLYSDESMDWIMEDRSFLKQWTFLMRTCIQNGTKIEIIHSLSRENSELAIAVQQWLPFYMSGAITSYYYPEKRDDMFNHTLFVLEGLAAISSTSIRGTPAKMIHYAYVTEPTLIQNAEQSFEAQLKLCKPLVRTFTGSNTRYYIDQQISFFTDAQSNGVAMQSLLLMGMPVTLLDSMLERSGISDKDRTTILLQHEQRIRLTHAHLLDNKFQLIINLPRITDVLKGYVPALIPELLTQKSFTYLPMEFHAHLQGLIELLETYTNLEICIMPQKHIIQTVQLFAVKNSGVLIFKHSDPKFVFISEQKDLINAIMSFINQESARIPKRERNKAFVLDKLYEFSKKIEERAKIRMLS